MQEMNLEFIEILRQRYDIKSKLCNKEIQFEKSQGESHSTSKVMPSDVINEAYNRISSYINSTPLMKSQLLNDVLLSNISFKCEGFQKVGAFKSRGALNTLLSLKEKGLCPSEVVAFSSGNHAQAVAWASKLLGIKASIIIPKNASPIKIAATRSYGANVILANDRNEAELLAANFGPHALLIPPYDHDDVIAGQGTAALEAWREEGNFDAVFAPCGGGGLISGTFLATRLFSKSAHVFAAEPLLANDAARSYRSGVIQKLPESPNTIADGARTLSVSPKTFQYIQLLNGFYEISEEEIVYWTQWLTHLLKVNVEPTSAMGMAAAYKWIQEGNMRKKILIILSGGNIDPSDYNKIWAVNHLNNAPRL